MRFFSLHAVQCVQFFPSVFVCSLQTPLSQQLIAAMTIVLQLEKVLLHRAMECPQILFGSNEGTNTDFLCVSSNRLYSVLSPGSACSCKSPQSWQAEAYSRFTASTLQQVYGYYFYFREPQFMLNKGTLLKSIVSLP